MRVKKALLWLHTDAGDANRNAYYYKGKFFRDEISNSSPIKLWPCLIMNVTITASPKEDYLLIESKGTVETMEGLLAHSQMIWQEISKHDFKRILVNEPETILPVDLAPYFNLVKNYVDSFPPEIYEKKIAVVSSGKYKEVMSSWETLCQSRGLQYFVFTSFEDAVNCLINDDDE